MKNVKEQYALIKMKIKELEDQARVLIPDIISELEGCEDMKLAEPYGKFSVVKTTRFEFTTIAKAQIEKIKEEEINTGKAKPIYTETLRFTPDKLAVPPGVYKF